MLATVSFVQKKKKKKHQFIAVMSKAFIVIENKNEKVEKSKIDIYWLVLFIHTTKKIRLYWKNQRLCTCPDGFDVCVVYRNRHGGWLDRLFFSSSVFWVPTAFSQLVGIVRCFLSSFFLFFFVDTTTLFFLHDSKKSNCCVMTTIAINGIGRPLLKRRHFGRSVSLCLFPHRLPYHQWFRICCWMFHIHAIDYYDDVWWWWRFP